MIKKILDQISEGCSITIHFQKISDGTVMVMVVPVIKNSETRLSPIVVTGSIDTIEVEIDNAISNPIKLANVTANSVIKFEASIKEAQEKTKEKKVVKDAKKTKATDQPSLALGMDEKKEEVETDEEVDDNEADDETTEAPWTTDDTPEAPIEEEPTNENLKMNFEKEAPEQKGFVGNAKSTMEGNPEKVGVKSAEKKTVVQPKQEPVKETKEAKPKEDPNAVAWF